MRRPRDGSVTILGSGVTLADPAPSRRRTPPIGPPRTAVATGDRPTRVLGLDLAMGTTGWCLLVGSRPEAHGSFELPAYQRKGETLAGLLGRRADELGRQVGFLVLNYDPELVGYEYPDVPRPFWSGGNKGREFSAVQGLSRAEGFLVALWPLIGRGRRLVSVPVTTAKRTVTGRVGATKDQVSFALRTHLHFDLRGWTEDEIDAAAVAVAAREML